jgi:hypothetical protein
MTRLKMSRVVRRDERSEQREDDHREDDPVADREERPLAQHEQEELELARAPRAGDVDGWGSGRHQCVSRGSMAK